MNATKIGRSLAQAWRRAIGLSTLAAALGLAACGGGGGGDASFTVDSTGGTDSQTYEGEDVPSVIIHMHVSDPNALSGKTLYLIAEVPEPALFQSTTASIDSDGRGGVLQLIGAKAPVGAKTYSGTIVVHACLDASCHKELSVTNGSVPYQLRVDKGLVLSTEVAELSADFGVMPESVQVDVGLPDNLESFTVEAIYQTQLGFDVEIVRDSSGAHLRIGTQYLNLPEQTVYDYARVTAVTTTGVTMTRALEIRQLTGPVTGRAWAFQRPTVTFNVTPRGGDGVYNAVLASALLPNGDSDRFHYLGTSYEWPPEADGNPVRDIWLSATQFDEGTTNPNDNYYINLTASRCYIHDCLPPGTYRAVMHYKYSPANGPEELVDHEITMNVAP